MLKFLIKTTERRHPILYPLKTLKNLWFSGIFRQYKIRRHRFCAFIVNFEYISYIFLVFLLLTLNRSIFAGICQLTTTQPFTKINMLTNL